MISNFGSASLGTGTLVPATEDIFITSNWTSFPVLFTFLVFRDSDNVLLPSLWLLLLLLLTFFLGQWRNFSDRKHRKNN